MAAGENREGLAGEGHGRCTHIARAEIAGCLRHVACIDKSASLPPPGRGLWAKRRRAHRSASNLGHERIEDDIARGRALRPRCEQMQRVVRVEGFSWAVFLCVGGPHTAGCECKRLSGADTPSCVLPCTHAHPHTRTRTHTHTNTLGTPLPATCCIPITPSPLRAFAAAPLSSAFLPLHPPGPRRLANHAACCGVAGHDVPRVSGGKQRP